MIYRKCKCGASERWDTGETVHPCEGCRKCETTFATSHTDHKALEPHQWEPRFNRRTAEPDRRMCARCHAIEKAPSP